ncbi:MAG: hydrogenase nickel incorporation protein HypB [Synergistota bacterium]|nr:hydrogenase nickel incorporation protein HypB [Synergistota bacterium]HHV52278.1 hydrogenase nickel incorporation protein HypB [Synergistaceae bacterium]
MPRLVEIRRSVMEADEEIAHRLREMLDRRGVLMLNLIGSPGSGKTTLLERSLIDPPFRSAVIEGDVETTRDLDRIKAVGVPVVQINTHGGCHLEANLVEKALERLPEGVDVIFIENVGNLVCPAEFYLGEDHKVAICSVAEGGDKPLKYPSLFHQASAVVLTKVDLKPYVPFDEATFWDDVDKLNPKAARLEVSAIKGEGISKWIDLVEGWLCAKRERGS